MTLNQIMAAAHKTAREIRAAVASYAEAMAEGLRRAWAEARTPAPKAGIEIVLTSQYGALSRGRHSARRGNGPSAAWAGKDGYGRLVITEPGVWLLHCSDGYSRSARATLTVDADGGWEMTGDTRRFDVAE